MKHTLFNLFSLIAILTLLLPAGGMPVTAQGPHKLSAAWPTAADPAQASDPSSMSVAASAYSVSGRVTDISGNPLAGVAVAAISSSTSGPVSILKVSADYDLAGYYPIGLGEVRNKISVSVDWGGKTPGKLRYQFGTGTRVEDAITGTQSSHTFRFDQVLQPGPNTLQITAIAADGTASAPRVYRLTGWTAEMGWLNQILGSLPYLGPDKVEFKVYVPGDPIDMLGLDVWLPGKPTKLGPQAVGKLTVPLMGGRYEAGLGARFERDKSTPGRKPWYGRNALSLLGKNDLETDFTSQFEGNLTNAFPYLDRPDLIKISASGEVTFEISESVLIVIQPLAPAGPVIVNGLKAVPPVYDWIKDRAKFYIELTPELGGEMTFNWADQDLRPVSANLYAQIEIEGGLKIDLFVAEGKVYVAGGSKLEFMFIPTAGIEKWVFYGKAGYELKAGWFKASREEKIEWVAYERGALSTEQLLADLQAGRLEWTLIPRKYALANYSAFAGQSPQVAPLAALAARGTISTLLVANTFPYVEPTLAVRGDDQALLLWNYDDLARPLGQGYDLQYSRWTGTAWTSPTLMMTDTYPDAGPQVAWLSDGNALAVWERLDDPALPVTATLDLTQTRKFGLAWAQYNAAANAWSAPQWLARTPGESNQTPELARAADGSVWAAWRNNPQGQLSGDAQSPDRILTARWSGSSWTAPQIAVAGIPGLSDLTLAQTGTLGALVWTAEFTPTGSQTPTMQLFTSQYNGAQWSAPQRLTDDSLQHTHPRLVYRQSQPTLVWLAGSTLSMQTLSALQSRGFVAAAVAGQTVALPGDLQVDQFSLLQDAAGNLYAVCTAQQAQQRDLYLAYFDAATNMWGQPQRLTDDALSQSYPAAALDSAQQLHVAYGQTAILTQVLTATLPGSTTVVSYTLPVDGATDLYTLRHSLRRDMAVETLAVSDEYPAPGGSVVLTATLANRGDRPLQNVAFVFQDNGVSFDSRTLPGPISAGQVLTLTAVYTPPVTGGARTLAAAADPLNAVPEADETNNMVSLMAFGPDLAISRLLLEQQGSQVETRVEVQNLGAALAPASVVNLYHDATTGTLLLSQALPALSASQTYTLTLAGDLGALPPGVHTLVAAANPGQASFAELATDNNVYTFTARLGADLALDPARVWTTPMSETQVALAVVAQNLGNLATLTTTLAVYDHSALQSAVVTTTLPSLAPGESVTLTATLAGPIACGLFLLADPQQALSEISRDNNLAAAEGGLGLCHQVYLPLTIRSATGAAATDLSLPLLGGRASDGAQAVASTYFATTDSNGNYIFSNLPAGEYLIVPPSDQGFSPAKRSVKLPPSAWGQDFVLERSLPACSVAPTLIRPTNGSHLNHIIPLFEWNSGYDPSATVLRLDAALDSGFTQMVGRLWSGSRQGAGQFRFPNNFNPATTHYWRAFLKCGESMQSPYSQVWSFTTGSGGTILPAPNLIAPAHGSTVPSTSATLQWSSVSGALEYAVYWSESGMPGTVYLGWTTGTQATISGLSGSTTYEWWIAARNDYAWGNDSVHWTFTTGPSGSWLRAPSSLSAPGDVAYVVLEDNGTTVMVKEGNVARR